MLHTSMPKRPNDATLTRAKFCAACFAKNAKIVNSKRKVFGGNVMKGGMKKSAGQRRGVRRSAKSALVVEKEGLD